MRKKCVKHDQVQTHIRCNCRVWNLNGQYFWKLYHLTYKEKCRTFLNSINPTRSASFFFQLDFEFFSKLIRYEGTDSFQTECVRKEGIESSLSSYSFESLYIRGQTWLQPPTLKNNVPDYGYMSPGSGTLFFWDGDGNRICPRGESASKRIQGLSSLLISWFLFNMDQNNLKHNQMMIRWKDQFRSKSLSSINHLV